MACQNHFSSISLSFSSLGFLSQSRFSCCVRVQCDAWKCDFVLLTRGWAGSSYQGSQSIEGLYWQFITAHCSAKGVNILQIHRDVQVWGQTAALRPGGFKMDTRRWLSGQEVRFKWWKQQIISLEEVMQRLRNKRWKQTWPLTSLILHWKTMWTDYWRPVVESN